MAKNKSNKDQRRAKALRAKKANKIQQAKSKPRQYQGYMKMFLDGDKVEDLIKRMVRTKAYDPAGNHWNQYSARVRAVEGNPFFDQIVRWDLEGNAINHELGDIAWGADGTGDYQLRQGENIFRF